MLAGIAATADALGGVGRWTSQGPPGGAVTPLAFDPVVPSTVYSVGEGQLLKSLDSGRTWRRISTPFFGIGLLKIHSSDPQTLYAGTYDGLFKSTDGGENWFEINNGIQTRPWSYRTVSGLALDPKTANVLYASIYGSGVFRSSDGGATWTPTNLGLPSLYPGSLVIDPGTTRTIYVGMIAPTIVSLSGGSIPVPMAGGVYKTTDSGSTWRACGLPGESIRALALDIRDPRVLYAGASAVYKTTDAGASWSTVYSGHYSSTVRSLTVDPHSPDTVYASLYSEGLLRTTDGGRSWEPIAQSLLATLVERLLVDPALPEVLYLGTDRGGVFKSVDRGMTWESINDGVAGARTGSVAVHPREPNVVYAGTLVGVFRSDDRGRTWQPTGFRDLNATLVVFDSRNPSTLYAATLHGILAKSTDEGRTWSRLEHRPPGLWYSPQVRSLVVDPDDSEILFAAADPGIRKSVDGGRTWTTIDPFGGPPYYGVVKLAVDPRDSTVYAGTGGVGVIKTIDGGRTWTATGLDRGSVTSLELDPGNPDVLYAIYSGGRSRTNDAGRSWVLLDPLPSGTTMWKVDPSDSSVLYAGTQWEGVFRSADSGATWQLFGGPFRESVRDLAVSADGGAIYAATDRGLYDLQIRSARPVPFRPDSVYPLTHGWSASLPNTPTPVEAPPPPQ
jgi:photosystem II stability/assembly factor-like uncharacterized protein